MGVNQQNLGEWFESIQPKNTASESQDTYNERSQSAQAQIRRIQKDENKAQWDNQKLFLVLKRFVSDPYFLPVVSEVSTLLAGNIPSRGVIAFISLFYPDATYFVATESGQKEKMNQLLSLHRYENVVDFDENTTHESIKNWIQSWIVLMKVFLSSDDFSKIMLQKMFNQMQWSQKIVIETTLGKFIVFFFAMRNVRISDEISLQYARFVIQEVIKTLQQKIQNFSLDDKKLIQASLRVDDFFWE